VYDDAVPLDQLRVVVVVPGRDCIDYVVLFIADGTVSCIDHGTPAGTNQYFGRTII
jgi:hypothetical protein